MMRRRGERTPQAEETARAKAGRHSGKELRRGGQVREDLEWQDFVLDTWSGFGGAERRDRAKSQLSQEAVQERQNWQEG